MKKNTKIKKGEITSTPIDLNEFFGQETIQKAGELYERLQEPLISGTDTGINLRNLNNWVTVLKLNDALKSQNRRKYTFAEFVWLKIVEQLREAGLSLLIISRLKTDLFEPRKISGFLSKAKQAKNFINELKVSKEQKEQLFQFLTSDEFKEASENVSFRILDLMITESIIKRIPLSIAVFLNGNFFPIDKTKEDLYPEQYKKRLLFETYISVSISGIISRFLQSDLAGFIVPEIGFFSHAENKLFELVHSGEYENITINFKDKKIKSLELKKNENIKERIVDILNKGAFGEIVVKKHKGEIVKIENTIKVTL